jgi:hypothetical protein
MMILIFVIKFSEVTQVYANCHRSMPHLIDIDLLSMPFKKLNSQTANYLQLVKHGFRMEANS